MGLPLARVGSTFCSHGSPIIAGSPTVMAQGKSIAVIGSPLLPHEVNEHVVPIFVGTATSTVFIGGLPAARIGDVATPCGGVLIGTSTVFAG